MVRFEYDLQGVESLGDDNLKNGMSVRFWETIAYSNEINNLDFPIGQPIYFTMDWGNYTQGLNYAIKSCALKDKRIGEEYAMLEQVIDYSKISKISESSILNTKKRLKHR